MDFGLSSEQTLMVDTLARMLEDSAPLDRVRRFADEPDAGAADIWTQLAELGITGLVVPEAHGGSGLGMLDAALVSQCLGAHVTPAPFVTSSVLAPLALMRAGNEAQCKRWLPRIAEGSTRFGLAISEHSGAREGAGVVASDGGLDGLALFVLDADADAYLVADQARAVFIVERDAPGVHFEPLVSIDRTRVLGELRLEHAAGDRLDGGGEGALLETLTDHARVMLAADTIGAAQHMLDAAVEYAGQREQFGRVIASFQAVKHLCADMAASLEPCHAMLWYAAHALDTVADDAHLYACHVKAHVAETGTQVARTATEVHGGVGFTDLLGLHYWFKRIGLNRQLLGSPERAREDAARAQGWT